MSRMLVLENGAVFYGDCFGSEQTVIAEIVFNTSMVGYQEIISDSANCQQIIVMSYPLIGNYGMTDEDYESKNITLAGLVVREYNDLPSNFRFTKTLAEVMTENKVPVISGVDTRDIVGILREQGSMKAMITDSSRDVAECVKEIKLAKLSKNLVKKVSSQKIWYSRTRNPLYNVVVIDCGTKISYIKKLNQYGCNVVVVPYNTPKEIIDNHRPDGLFISSGPGNPKDIPEVIQLVKSFKGSIPILGIELGCQAIALAYGADTYKMKFGHRGNNHSVKDLLTDKVSIVTQNHSFSICQDSLKKTELSMSYINLLDSSVEGIMDICHNVFGIQFQVGTDDKEYITFTEQMQKMGGEKHAQKNRY